ncbi:MAG TPA: arginine--tRNA ligase [Bacteroidia bacterium]|jgi:arginyl-tRNA synthetase|nr:arginine--tRNA ligase [Bacteroidia bacterium]
MNILTDLTKAVKASVKDLYGKDFEGEIVFQKTRKEFEGEVTLVAFPFLKLSGKKPEDTGADIGNYLLTKTKLVKKFNIVKGFLNISMADSEWLNYFGEIIKEDAYAIEKRESSGLSVMVEYPSPNTNKPLHLGHLRNIFLGSSVAEILKARGHKVIHSCLYNDRGTNISKSMLAWKLYGNGATPQSTGLKGDHLVGDFYVKYSAAYKKEIDELKKTGLSEEEAEKKSELARQVTELTVAWENNDTEVRKLWKMMNDWFHEGVAETYKSLGTKTDKNYYESDVYNLGKETVKEGLQKGVFYQKEDSSVWIDLTADGLDHKLVLRSNGTSVYITQDIATANEKERNFKIDKSIYVVGNEQDYHFKVLFLILKKLGRTYADNLYHLSYGMVELPTGKMKSREGTVVDADDLISGMIDTAKKTTQQLGKTEGLTEEGAKNLFKIIGLGALRYFILKVDPKKKMLFDPNESIDFNGHTGPFIQYTHARIQSVLRKSGLTAEEIKNKKINPAHALHQKETDLIHLLSDFKNIIAEAEYTYNPALIANYIYEIAKAYNQFYHELSVLSVENEEQKLFRVQLSYKCALAVKQGMALLCIEVPDKM